MRNIFSHPGFVALVVGLGTYNVLYWATSTQPFMAFFGSLIAGMLVWAAVDRPPRR